MRRPKILVINPNSNVTVTDGLRDSLQLYATRAEIDCNTLRDGPFGIESDADIENVIPFIRDKISHSQSYDAFVIACYSDPGVEDCRTNFDQPILGLQESALIKATSFGGKFGVLALSAESIRRHLQYIRKLGFGGSLAREVALNISVDEAANDSDTARKVISAGQTLVNDHAVSAIILGCAGMANTKQIAEKKLPVPIIEPAQAAVELAIESVCSD